MKISIPNFKKLSTKEIEEIREKRKQLFQNSKNTPKEGLIVKYLDKDFILYPNVFHPFEDSKALVENFIINDGDVVLDLGTGSGLIAIFSAYMGSKKVIATDVNIDSVKNAKENIKRHNFEDTIKTLLSDGFKEIDEGRRFDVIVSNPPFTDEEPQDVVEKAGYDKNFSFHKNIFQNLDKYLKEGGRFYLAQANFGPLEEVFDLAEKYGYEGKLIGINELDDDPRTFYAFEFIKV